MRFTTGICISAIGVLSIAPPATTFAQENPHNGYVFWLPCGELKVGDAASEKVFQVKREGGVISFVVHPRRTRFDVPKGQLAIVMPANVPGNKALKRWPKLETAEGPRDLTPVVFLPDAATAGKTEVKLDAKELPNGALVRFYWTDDSDKLGVDLAKALYAPDANGVEDAYGFALVDLFSGKPEVARARFKNLAERVKGADSQRLCRRMMRWCDAEVQFKKIQTGPGAYDLGLYCMVNGFWDLAERSFRQATVKMPTNPDAWYMLADALSYKESDLDTKMEAIYPYYRKAADLYPRTNSNTFRTYFGFFRNLKIKDGDSTKVLHMSDEQIAYAKKAWGWCSAIMEAASKGALRMENTYKVYDQEFDSTRDWDPRPFRGLFRPGTVDTFIKMTGWGASDCCGMDTGPDRSAFVNLGIREWDVMLHEWNHSLDWNMVSSELGVGVPETHASDWCGFEPISSMGMGHHSCNRYYMTPGMYRFLRGTDPATTPYVDDWAVASPSTVMPDVVDLAKLDEAFFTAVRQKTEATVSPAADAIVGKPVVEGGYVDLKATWPQATKNSTAFAKTYVYSPKTQKIRTWLGADDNARIWLNGVLVHKGVYWCCCQFFGRKMKDQLSGAMTLQKGWNQIVMQVTSRQQGKDWQTDELIEGSWGFSLRFCDTQNQPVPGLKWQSAKPAGFVAPVAFAFNPAKPKTYEWAKVADDYTSLLPALTVDNLRALTGYETLSVTNEMLFDYPGAPLAKADPKVVALDNQLNWFFSPKELSAVVRYRRGSLTRDLLLIRPEGYEAFLRLIPVSAQAKALGVRSHAGQVIGYLTVPRPDSANGRIVLVVDTRLGDRLPVDEEDLLDIRALK